MSIISHFGRNEYIRLYWIDFNRKNPIASYELFIPMINLSSIENYRFIIDGHRFPDNPVRRVLLKFNDDTTEELVKKFCKLSMSRGIYSHVYKDDRISIINNSPYYLFYKRVLNITDNGDISDIDKISLNLCARHKCNKC